MRINIFLLILIFSFSFSSGQKLQNGLIGDYYQGYKIDTLDHIIFDGLTKSFSRVDTVIDFWNGSQYYSWQPVAGWGNNYGVEWNGYIFIEEAGKYGFGTISDDGSQIFLNDSLIVDNGESQWYDWEDNISEGDTSNTPFSPLILTSGYHKISVRFFENASYDGIEMWWIKPSEIDSSDIPYYGKNFHQGGISFNANTNWSLVPAKVLFTDNPEKLFALNDTVYATPGDTINIDVLANDYHENGVTFKIDSFDDENTVGSVTLNDSFFTYIAPQNSMVDSFNYTIKDDSLNEATAIVNIIISDGIPNDQWTVALYNFENDNGDLIRDISGNNLHALNDSTIAEQGRWGKMRRFSGQASIEMDVVREALQEATEWSIEFLGRSLDSLSTPGFVNHSNGNGWVLLPSGTAISYGVKTTATNQLWISGGWASLSAGPRDTSWHYYAMTYRESDSLRVYKDGKFLGGYGVTGQFKLSSETGFKAFIGHSDYGDIYYNGLADEVRVSDIMRSKKDIEELAMSLNLFPAITAVENNMYISPQKFSLYQNYPNPFNPQTTIKYQIPKTDQVKIILYDVNGREIQTLVNKRQEAGIYNFKLDASDLPSGIYFYQLQTADGFNQTRKMVLLK